MMIHMDTQTAPRKHSYLKRRDGESAKDWRRRTFYRKVTAKKAAQSGLKASDFPWPTRCPALGILLDYTGADIKRGWSLDCWDPALGYVPGNVRIISRLANRIKSDATYQEVEQVAAWMRKEAIRRVSEAKDEVESTVEPGESPAVTAYKERLRLARLEKRRVENCELAAK